MAFGLNGFADSLGIQKKSSTISNELFNQIDSEIESSKSKIKKQLAETEIVTQGFDEVKTTKTVVIVPEKAALILPTKDQSEIEEKVVNEGVVPDVIAEHISEARVPAASEKVYKNASIDDELSTELEGLASNE